MKNKNKVWYFTFLFGSSFLLIELLSRVLLPQPIFSPRTFEHSDGLRTNKNNGVSSHSFFNRKKTSYYFGGLYSRINPKRNFKTGNLKDKNKKCKFLILGDSYVFGWLVNYEDTFVSLVENRINDLSFDKKFYFLNSARGGAGFDFYTAFTDKFKNEILDYDGIILFANSDDPQRILRNEIYKFNKANQLLLVKKTDTSNKLRQLINKYKLLNISYSILLENFNILRIVHNLYMHGSAQKKFDPNKDLLTYNAPGVKYMNNILIKDKAANKVQIDFLKSLIKKFAENTKKIPTTIIYIGSSRIDELSGLNSFFYSNEGKKVLQKNNIDYEFDLINNAPVYDPKNDLIIGDWHPNETGHKKIAEAILQSKNKNGLKEFTSRNCQN